MHCSDVLEKVRRHLRPVEWMALAAFFVSFLIVKLFGRPYFFLLVPNLKAVAVQLNWLAPCFVLRHFFAIHRVRPVVSRCVYLGYYLLLSVVFMGSAMESVLSNWVVLRKAAILIQWTMGFNAILVMAAVALTLVPFKRKREQVMEVVKGELRDALMILRLTVSMLICYAVYTNMKVMVPVVHPGLMDDVFYAMDKRLFLGNDPYAWIQTHSTTLMNTMMERSYFFFFFFIVFGLTGSYLFGSVACYERSMTAFLVIFMMGIVAYFLFPTVGPAFYDATEPYLKATSSNVLKQYLLSQYIGFCKDPANMSIRDFAGLAAFPSLHAAHSIMFMYYLGKREIWMPVILAIPLLMLFVATVWLGWHWAMDLLGGGAVAWLAILLVGRLCPEESVVLDKPEDSSEI